MSPVSPTPPAVQELREAVWQLRMELDCGGVYWRDGEVLYTRDFRTEILQLWDRWRSRLPWWAPPETPKFRTLDEDPELWDTYPALESLLHRLEDLFGPPAAPVGRELGFPAWEPAGERPEPHGGSPSSPADNDSETGMLWQDARDRLQRLRAQGEPWTSYKKLGKQVGCSPSTVHTAVQNTPSLHSWAKPPTAGTPKAQSINAVVTDRTAQSKEPDPADEVAIREYLERDLKPDERAWFNSLSRQDQIDFLDDPGQHPRIFGRAP